MKQNDNVILSHTLFYPFTHSCAMCNQSAASVCHDVQIYPLELLQTRGGISKLPKGADRARLEVSLTGHNLQCLAEVMYVCTCVCIQYLILVYSIYSVCMYTLIPL